jgi:hypothetical protein
MSITSANAIIQIGVAIVFPTPQQMQGFTTDDIYGVGAIKPNEVKIGVDGNMSAGKIWQLIPITYHLQADSPSNDFFDAWKQAEDAAVDTFIANGLIVLPGLGKKFTLFRGSLTNYIPVPPAGNVLRERAFEITWNKVFPAGD